MYKWLVKLFLSWKVGIGQFMKNFPLTNNLLYGNSFTEIQIIMYNNMYFKLLHILTLKTTKWIESFLDME